MICSFGRCVQKAGRVLHNFEISKLVVLTIQQAGKMTSLLVESLHIRIDSKGPYKRVLFFLEI